MTESLDVTLRALPHFKAVPADLLAQFASMSRILRPQVGEILFHEGDPCRQFYAIHSGAVKLYRAQADGREQIVHNLHAGATFAEVALLSLGRFPVNAVVTESSTVLVEIGGQGEALQIPKVATRKRTERLVKVGLRLLLLAVLTGVGLPAGQLQPQPEWPPRDWPSDHLIEVMMDQS